MLLQDLTKRLEEYNKQKLEIKQKEKELANKALEERVLEVKVADLIDELRVLTNTKKFSLNYSPVYASASCAKSVEAGKIWLKNRNPKLHITICGEDAKCYTITQNFAEIKLSNGDFASEHIYIDYVKIGIKNEYRYEVMLNISPLDKELNNPIFKQAVYNCVEKREVELNN